MKYGEYWLRSPWHSSADNGGYGASCVVDEEGYCGSATYVCYTDHGVVPMLNLRLSD